MDPVDLVRSSYDAIAEAYASDRREDGEDIRLLSELESRLPENADVLDLGCGSGHPITARLTRRFRVTGVDISPRQIDLARAHVPSATFHCADMLEWDFGTCRWSGICSYYALIHIPRAHHRDLLRRIAGALRNDGLALLCLGAEDLPEDVADDYFGKSMYWSHFDAATYLRWLPEIGLRLEGQWLVRDASCPTACHFFVLCSRLDEFGEA